MEQFGITERQLNEEFTLKRVRQISIYNEINNQIQKEREREQERKSRG